MFPTTTELPSARRLSAVAVLFGWRNAKQFFERGPHFESAGPSPIAPSTFTRTTSAPETSGRSGPTSESGSARSRNCFQSVWAAESAQPGSRSVPRVTSPPAQRRNGAESWRSLAGEPPCDLTFGAEAADALRRAASAVPHEHIFIAG